MTIVRTILIILPMLVATLAAAAELHVEPGGLGDYPDIQSALDVAQSGDEIVLHDGVFTGPGNFDLRPGDKSVTVRSLSGSATECIIDLQGHGGFWQEGTYALRLEFITVQGGSRTDGGGVHVWHGSFSAVGCHFRNNSGDSGIWLVNSSSNTFDDCLFTGNSGSEAAVDLSVDYATFLNCKFVDNGAGSSGAVIDNFGGHLRLENTVFRDNRVVWYTVHVHFASCWVDQCLFAGNHAGQIGGIDFWAGGGQIWNSTFVANTGEDAAHLFVSDYDDPGDSLYLHNCLFAHGDARQEVVIDLPPGAVHVFDCNIFTAGQGWPESIADQLGAGANMDLPPVFCDLQNGVYTLADVSPCLPANNPAGELVGIYGEGCEMDTWQVDADGFALLTDIQSALDLAPAGAEIVLADGVFTGPRNRDLTFPDHPVTLRAIGGPDACTIDAEAALGDDFRCLVFDAGQDTTTVVEGLTLTGGGNGAVTCDGSGPLLRGCRLTGNRGGGYSGAVSVSGAGRAVLDGCVIDANQGNLGAAVAVRDGGHAVVRNCTVAGNDSQASSLLAWDAGLTLERSIVWGDLGGVALAAIGAVDLTVTDCNIRDNAGGDWTGPLADLLGEDGNFDEDPCFCDPGAGLFALCADSWCLPEYNPHGRSVLVGALDAGCEACGCADITGVVPVAGVSTLAAAPNPFNPATELSFVLGQAADVRLELVDLRGRSVRVLHDGPLQAGRQTLRWDGRDGRGRRVSGGIYLARLQMDGQRQSIKLALCK